MHLLSTILHSRLPKAQGSRLIICLGGDDIDLANLIYLGLLFLAKVFDNALGTAKAILIQRGHGILAGVALVVSNFLYYSVTKSIVSSDSDLAIWVVSVASGIGCCLAIAVNNKLSKDRTYINVIMSDNKEAMQSLRDFLAEHHITNVAADSYTRDWNTKTITVTAYAETKAESELIDAYISKSPLKFKRVIQKT